jgi:signal transduction histidine kinase
MLILISLPSRLTIYQRKLFLTIGFYNFGFQLMYDSGMDTSGILYWTIGNIMALLFFKSNNYLLIFVLNSCMSIVIGMIIYFKSSSPYFSQGLSIPDWFLISANNIFLSAIIAVLFTELVRSLHQIIVKQRLLKRNYEINVQSLKKSNVSLVSKNKELEQMAYVISHDLQEPIRMIVSFLGRLIEKYKPQLTSGNKQLIYDSISKATKMKNIVTDLLELSILDIENQTKEVIQLEKLIHQLFIQKDIELIPTLEIKENKSLYIYEKPIRKIIDNLIDNSISKNKSTANINISISCISSNGYWVIAYHDNAFVFETVTNEDFSVLNYDHFLEDFGLDLTISKLLIDQLNGDLWVTTVNQQLIISFKIPI